MLVWANFPATQSHLSLCDGAPFSMSTLISCYFRAVEQFVSLYAESFLRHESVSLHVLFIAKCSLWQCHSYVISIPYDLAVLYRYTVYSKFPEIVSYFTFMFSLQRVWDCGFDVVLNSQFVSKSGNFFSHWLCIPPIHELEICWQSAWSYLLRRIRRLIRVVDWD